MRPVRDFLRFPHLAGRDWLLILKAGLMVCLIRLGLWVLPFRYMCRLPERAARRPGQVSQGYHHAPDQVAWSVAVASRFVPAATCLTQALAVQVLLARRGYPTRLRISVVRGSRGQLEAHAWVESQGRQVFGGSRDLARFTPLPPLDGAGG